MAAVGSVFPAAAARARAMAAWDAGVARDWWIELREMADSVFILELLNFGMVHAFLVCSLVNFSTGFSYTVINYSSAFTPQ